MKIGFFGSSFDPPTYAHLNAARNLANQFGLDHVIMGPGSNQRPDKRMKTSDEHRWNMLLLAVDQNPLFILDRYEMDMEASKVFTYFTMEHYKAKYPNDDLYFMMGTDLLVDIAKGLWDYGKELVESNEFIVTSRNDDDLQSIINNSEFLRPYNDGRFHLFQQKQNMEISSTEIRRRFAADEDPVGLLPDKVIHYIKENRLYR